MSLRNKLAKAKQTSTASAPTESAEPVAATPAPAAPAPTEVVEPEVVEPEVVETKPEPKPKKEEPVKKEEPKQQTQLAPRVAAELGQPRSLPAGMEGNWDSSDFEVSRIGLVQKIGELSTNFEYCSFVYDKQKQLNSAGEPLYAIVVAANKYWQEVKDFDDELPKQYSSLVEAEADGFREGYTKDGCVARAADLDLLIVVDEDFDTDIEFNGVKFILARYTVAKSSYSAVAKKIATAAARGMLKDGLHHAVWELSATERVDGRMAYAVPTLKNPKHSEGEDGIGKGFISWATEEGYAA